MVNVSVDPSGLAPGVYTGKIAFAASTAVNKSSTVNVTLNVTAGVPTVAVNGVWPKGAQVNSQAAIITPHRHQFLPEFRGLHRRRRAAYYRAQCHNHAGHHPG